MDQMILKQQFFAHVHHGIWRTRLAFLTGIVLIVPTSGLRYFDFQNKICGRKIIRGIFSTPAESYPVFLVTRCNKIRSYWIVRKKLGVKRLGVFLHHFADPANVLLPYQGTIFYPIRFRLIVPHRTSKVTGASAHLKSVTQARPF